jgi:UDP-N-acetylmuramoyl-tripeptide--D-alanyl-D-alanine ligase
MFVWQRKEYRVDKMLDYISSPESKPILFDRFSITYYIILSVQILLIVSVKYIGISNQLLGNISIICIMAAIATLAGESIIGVYKWVRRSAITPVFTKKSIVVSLVTGVLLLIALGLVFESTLFLFIASVLAIILSIPIVIGASLLLVYPLDQFMKKRIIRRAKIHRESLKYLTVIAISGSYGKTTTKELLYHLLASQATTEKTEKNQNTTLSVARKILSLTPETTYFIAELGAYKKGDGAEICEFLQPTHSIVTGLNFQHYSLFGSEENIIQAESESLSFIPQNSIAILQGSGELNKQIICPAYLKPIWYGLENENLNAFATNIHTTKHGTKFTYHHLNIVHEIETNLVSPGNIENLVAALSCVLALGISYKDITPLLNTFPSTAGTLEIIPTSWGSIINDSYNANSNGVINALLTLKSAKGSKIVVLDDILELGTYAHQTHKEIAIVLQSVSPDLLILVGRNYSSIIQETMNNLDFKGSIIQATDIVPAEIISSDIRSLLKKPTTILLEGYQSQKYLQPIFDLDK